MFDKDVYTHAFAPCIHIVCAVAIMAPDPCLPETGISNARLLQCYHVHRVVMHSRGRLPSPMYEATELGTTRRVSRSRSRQAPRRVHTYEPASVSAPWRVRVRESQTSREEMKAAAVRLRTAGLLASQVRATAEELGSSAWERAYYISIFLERFEDHADGLAQRVQRAAAYQKEMRAAALRLRTAGLLASQVRATAAELGSLARERADDISRFLDDFEDHAEHLAHRVHALAVEARPRHQAEASDAPPRERRTGPRRERPDGICVLCGQRSGIGVCRSCFPESSDEVE